MKKGQSDGKLRRGKTKKKALDYLKDSVGAGKPPLYLAAMQQPECYVMCAPAG